MDNKHETELFEKMSEPNDIVAGSLGKGMRIDQAASLGDKEIIWTHETCPLNPATNKNYADEIEKSFQLLLHSREAEFFNASKNEG